MRTSSFQKSAHAARYAVITALKGERNYWVCGAISFVFCGEMAEGHATCKKAVLRKAILTADRESPWQDLSDLDGSPLQSIHYLSDGHVGVNYWANPETVISFNIVPEADHIRKSQVYAYEKYIQDLARRLHASHLFRDIKEIVGGFTVKSTKSYRVD